MAAGSRTPPEGIYRRISVRMYSDERFRRLSPPPPSGQSLWVYLLTGPHTGPIPGVFVAGRAALAEALEWSMEDFQKVFLEVTSEGLAEFDEKTRMWFIPNAIRHNTPRNPNVVKSWRSAWIQLPEGPLRDRIFDHVLGELTEVSEAYAKAFQETCGKTFDNALPKSSGNKPRIQDKHKHKHKHEDIQSPKGDCSSESSDSDALPLSDDEHALKVEGLPDCPHQLLLELFAENAPSLPQPRAELWAGAKADALRARWKWVLTAKRTSGPRAGERYARTEAEALDFFARFFAYVEASDFLSGRGENGWQGCSLSWLVQQGNFAKVMEGNYVNQGDDAKPAAPREQTASAAAYTTDLTAQLDADSARNTTPTAEEMQRRRELASLMRQATAQKALDIALRGEAHAA